MMQYKKMLLLTGSILLSSMITLNASEESKSKEKTAKAVASLTEAGNKDKAEAGITANALLKNAYATINGLKKYSFEAKIVNEDDLDGEMMLYLTHHYTVSVERPDKIRMDVRGDVDNRNSYVNKGTVTIMNADKSTYGQVKVSANINEALDDLSNKYGFAIPLTQFLYSDMAKDTNVPKEGFFLGEVFVDSKPCYYLAFPSKEWDIQVWIEKGETPLIRKIAYVDKMAKGQPRSMISINWDLDPKLSEEIFTFKAPEEAYKAKVLTVEESKNAKMKAKDK